MTTPLDPPDDDDIADHIHDLTWQTEQDDRESSPT